MSTTKIIKIEIQNIYCMIKNPVLLKPDYYKWVQKIQLPKRHAVKKTASPLYPTRIPVKLFSFCKVIYRNMAFQRYNAFVNGIDNPLWLREE